MELAVYGRKKIGFCLHAEISVSFFFFPLEDMVLLPRMLKIYCPLSVMLEISLIKYIRSLLSLIDQSIHSMNYIGPL